MPSRSAHPNKHVLVFVAFLFGGAVAAARNRPPHSSSIELPFIPSLLAQAVTLAVAFVVRFLFQSRVVYRPRRISPLLYREAEEVELPLPPQAE